MRLCFLLLVTLFGSTFGANLRICHTNDFHARYDETNEFDSPCSDIDAASGNCYSGIARLTAGFASLSCDLKIQVGDFVQGTIYDTVFGADIAIAGYRWVGYDLAVLGNHEFNRGPEDIYKMVAGTPAMTWLNSNVNFTAAPPGFQINKYWEAFGICWVGSLTRATVASSKPGPTAKFADETVAVRRALANCAQTERVIAVNHQGFEEDIEMCKKVKELDLVLSAHTHTNLDNGRYPVRVTREDGSVCYVAQAYAFGRYIGVLDVEFSADGAIKLPAHQYVAMDARVPKDPAVERKMAVFRAEKDAKVKVKVGELTAEAVGGDICRTGECTMGNLAADAVLREGEKQGATVALLNAGGIRASIAQGDVTTEEALAVFPFGNVHAIVTLTGADIVAALEHGFTAIDKEDFSGRFPQVAGMTVTADLTRPAGSRVIDVVLDGGVNLDRAKTFKLVTSNFLATGGDDFVFPQGDIALSGRTLFVLLQEYMSDNSPVTPKLEGRIKI